jgi:cytochrome c peroxidase
MRRRTWWIIGGLAAALASTAMGPPDTTPVAAQVPAAGSAPAGPPTAEVSGIKVPEGLKATIDRMTAEKPDIAAKHQAMLAERYDLADQPADGSAMTRGKKLQGGVRVKLPAGVDWEQLSAMPAADIKQKGMYPKGFLPLPHPNHPEGGMLFPKKQIDEIKRQEGSRDLTRFDLDFDLPDHLMPEFPPPIFLTTHPELGDVSGGELVTIDNFNRLFSGILNPKQLEGLRLLVTPFPQQQFNATEDRRSVKAHQGVTCFDCHVNGHTNGAPHLVGDIRPQDVRHRIEPPSLRGVNVQRLFGSQRALRSIEDFTEFEQRAAYFDGDPITAAKKGVNPLERGSQVHFMAEFQSILDFPPADKLDVLGKLDPSKATEQELRGQELFFGKAQCSQCHNGPYYTDNTMHNLKTERFYEPVTVLGHKAVGDGPIKTFPLRGIKDSPPYLHDGRLLTLEDTVEFFNLVMGTKLTTAEKADVVAFMKCL